MGCEEWLKKWDLCRTVIVACSCCWLFAVIAFGGMGVIALTYDNPEISLEQATFTGLNLTATNISWSLENVIKVENPNGWPITVALRNCTVRVYSLDREAGDGEGQPILLGKSAKYPRKDVDHSSRDHFRIDVSSHMKPNDMSFHTLRARLGRDCGPQGPLPVSLESGQTTRVRVVLSKLNVMVAFLTADFKNKELVFDTEAPCSWLESRKHREPPEGESSPTTTSVTPRSGSPTTLGTSSNPSLRGSTSNAVGPHATTLVLDSTAVAATELSMTTSSPAVDGRATTSA